MSGGVRQICARMGYPACVLAHLMPPAAQVLDHLCSVHVSVVADVTLEEFHALLVLAPGQVRRHVALPRPDAAVPAHVVAKPLQLLASIFMFVTLQHSKRMMSRGSSGARPWFSVAIMPRAVPLRIRNTYVISWNILEGKQQSRARPVKYSRCSIPPGARAA